VFLQVISNWWWQRHAHTVLLMGVLFVVHMPTVLAMASAHMATVSHPRTKEHQARALLKPADS
jgi:hypothetical protein